MPTVTVLFVMLRAALTDRQTLMLEIAVLRQQVIVLKRGAGRPRIEDSDRASFVRHRPVNHNWRSPRTRSGCARWIGESRCGAGWRSASVAG